MGTALTASPSLPVARSTPSSLSPEAWCVYEQIQPHEAVLALTTPLDQTLLKAQTRGGGADAKLVRPGAPQKATSACSGMCS